MPHIILCSTHGYIGATAQHINNDNDNTIRDVASFAWVVRSVHVHVNFQLYVLKRGLLHWRACDRLSFLYNGTFYITNSNLSGLIRNIWSILTKCLFAQLLLQKSFQWTDQCSQKLFQSFNVVRNSCLFWVIYFSSNPILLLLELQNIVP